MEAKKPENSAENTTKKPLRRKVRGSDGAVASAGLAVGAVLVAVLGASSWWTLHTYRNALQRARTDQVGVVGRLLSQTAESMLSDGELTGLRRMVTDAAASYDLGTCRVVLSDGSVIADANPDKITVKKLPESWGQTDVSTGGEPVVPVVDGAAVTLSTPLVVTGRGGATLELAAKVEYPLWADWEVQAGIGVIGVGGFAGLLAVYRSMRAKWRVMGAIRDSLRSVQRGDDDPGALVVAEAMGSEAVAWNGMLEERTTLRAAARLEKAAEKIAMGGGHGGDLAGACDALWQGLLVLDSAGTIRYANGAAAVLLRTKREELIGVGVGAVLNDAGATEAAVGVATGKNKQRAAVELSRGPENGEKAILRLTVKPMRRDDTYAALMVVEDVSQQRAADESRNAFVAQATHELRTPLTNMRLYVEAFQEDGENDPQVRAKCINVIAQEARRLERIVSDMLSVSEIEAGALKLHRGEVRLDALFEELEADFRAQSEDKEIGLAFELPPKLPVMSGDRDKLLLALHNLVGNALKYTPPGGRVMVKINENGATLSVDVTDNGIGIKEDEQELVFEKFYRAKDRRIAGITGSGIGLALARQVIRMHGGDITVRSAIDKGSTFTLSVPLAEGGEVRQAA